MERDSHDETSSGKGHATHRSAYLNHKYNGKEKTRESEDEKSDVDQCFASTLSVSSDSSYASVITSSNYTDMQSIQDFGSVIALNIYEKNFANEETCNNDGHIESPDEFESFKSPETSIIEHFYKEYEPIDCDAGNIVTNSEVQYKVREFQTEQDYSVSEIDSDTENKLLVENVKNREYEYEILRQKISLQNSVNSNSSNSSSFVPSDLDSVSDTTKRYFGENTRNKQLALYNGYLNNQNNKQKCEVKRQVSFKTDNIKQVGRNQKVHINNNNNNNDKLVPTTKINRCENLKRITITISTKQTSEVSETTNDVRQLERYTTDSDEITDSTDDLSDSEPPYLSQKQIDYDDSSFVTSIDVSDKESECFLSMVSASDLKKESESDESRYFDCTGDLDETVLREKSNLIMNPQRATRSSRSPLDDLPEIKIPPRRTKKATRRSQSSTKSSSETPKPMIHIVQELSQNKSISSTVTIDKDQVKLFKENRSERRKVIDDSFCDEILTEAFKTTLSTDDENNSKEIEKHATMDYKHKQWNPDVIKPKLRSSIKDDCSIGRLESSPKYTGKLIGNLLAKRLERAETMTNLRRSLLQNMTFTIENNDLTEKKLSAIPPIKPPRSFTASSSSSPQSKQSVNSSATIPIEELQRANQHQFGFLSPTLLQQKLEFPKNFENLRNTELPNNFRANFFELERNHVNVPMGWLPAAQNVNITGSALTTRMGWIHPNRDIDNESAAPASNHVCPNFTQSNQRIPLEYSAPKENIDTVDCANNNARDFERFSANLNECPHNNLSTPIKDNYNVNGITDFFDVNRSLNASNNQTNLSSICDKCLPAEREAEPRCKQCNGKIKQSPKNQAFNFLSNKKGKKIGKAALKRTKTIFGASKHLLTKQKSNKKDSTSDHRTISRQRCLGQDIPDGFFEPMKDLDNTARFNSNTYSSHNYQKTIDKSLNLTAKHDNIVAMQSNPEEERKRTDENFVRFAPSKPIRRSINVKRSKSLDESGNTIYVTPNTTFNFDRMVQSPSKLSSMKKSPSKIMSKLKVFTKSGGIFGSKGAQLTPKNPSLDSYYRSYMGNEVDQKVPLISELLMSLKQNVESNFDDLENREADVLSIASSSTRRKLFPEQMSSSEDILDKSTNEVTEVQLHDEPEPLYAEIPIQRQQRNSNEHKINSQVPHITVNKNPNVVYAVVNRNTKTVNNVGKNAENITREALNNSVLSIQSYESLNLSVINDFAQSVQNLIQNQQNNTDGSKNCNEHSQQSDSPISNVSSGCTAAVRKIIGKTETNFLEIKVESDAISSQSGSYCESVSRGNDLNGEIKTLIEKLESVSSDFHDSDESFIFHDKGNDYILSNNQNRDERKVLEEAKSEESFKMDEIMSNNTDSDPLSFDIVDGSLHNTSVEYESPLSLQLCDGSEMSKKTLSWSTGSKETSPNYKALNQKIRNSIRKGKDYFKNGTKKLSNHFDKSDKTPEKELNWDIIQKDALTPNQRKQINQIFELLRSQLAEVIKSPTLSKRDENLIRVINKISRQQEVRHQLRNALQICRMTKEFQHSAELVESERLMLISHLKEWAGKLELVRISSLKDENSDLDDQVTGVVAIKELEFYLNKEVIYDTHFNHFYMCVCSYRDQIECTSAKERNGNRVVFNDSLQKFIDIEQDFEIRVDVYVLRLRKNVFLPNGEVKLKSNKNNEKKSLYDSIENSPTNSFSKSDINSSRFRLQASTLISRAGLFLSKTKQLSTGTEDPGPLKYLRKTSNGSFIFSVSHSKPFTFTSFARNSNQKQSIQITYDTAVTFDGSKLGGFLNMANGKWFWNRLWCEIDGICLKFWTYPQDANDLPPVLTINLKRCSNESKIGVVDRETCPRARVFSITLVPEKSDLQSTADERSKTYYIATDTNVELKQWLTELNRKIKFIRDWNI